MGRRVHAQVLPHSLVRARVEAKPFIPSASSSARRGSERRAEAGAELFLSFTVGGRALLRGYAGLLRGLLGRSLHEGAAH